LVDIAFWSVKNDTTEQEIIDLFDSQEQIDNKTVKGRTKIQAALKLLSGSNCFVGGSAQETAKRILEGRDRFDLDKLHKNTDILTLDNAHFIMSSASNNNIGNNLKIVRPFAFMCIFERDTDFTEEHGTKRFSVIFSFADGIATYDAIFGNNNAKAPFIVVLQDHGFGGNYDTFGQGGLMEKIAQKTNVYPDIIMVADNTEIWNGYKKVDCNSVHGGAANFIRSLYEKK